MAHAVTVDATEDDMAPVADNVPVTAAEVVVIAKIGVPPTERPRFVPAVPYIPVFAVAVGLTEHVVAPDANVDDSGPADVNPPEPEVIVAVPEQVIGKLAAGVTAAVFTVNLRIPPVAIENEPAPDEKSPSFKDPPMANAGAGALPTAEHKKRPLVNVALPVVTDNPPVDIVTPEPLEKVLAPEIV